MNRTPTADEAADDLARTMLNYCAAHGFACVVVVRVPEGWGAPARMLSVSGCETNEQAAYLLREALFRVTTSEPNYSISK